MLKAKAARVQQGGLLPKDGEPSMTAWLAATSQNPIPQYLCWWTQR